jgi:hypothetical protein
VPPSTIGSEDRIIKVFLGLVVAGLLLVGGAGAFRVQQLRTRISEAAPHMLESRCHLAKGLDMSSVSHTEDPTKEGIRQLLHLDRMAAVCHVRLQESWSKDLEGADGTVEMTIPHPDAWTKVETTSSPLSCTTEVQRLEQDSNGFQCSYAPGKFEAMGVVTMPKKEVQQHSLFLALLEFSRTRPFIPLVAAFGLLSIFFIVGSLVSLVHICINRKRVVAAREFIDEDELALPAPYHPLSG